jgi:uncharacterized membrane protein YedE/YeeE
MISYEFVDEWNKFNKGKLLSKPVVASDWGIPTSKVIDAPLIAGSFLFGIGWGVASLCPGPALWSAAAGHHYVIWGWLPAFMVGSRLADRLSSMKLSTKKIQ